jgi:hypothetical protein
LPEWRRTALTGGKDHGAGKVAGPGSARGNPLGEEAGGVEDEALGQRRRANPEAE